jgi:hypothetical protein
MISLYKRAWVQLKNKPAKDLSYWYVNFEERQISNSSILISSMEINIVKVPLECKQEFCNIQSDGKSKLK